MKPLISIIIPVYNAENYLKKCLDSILEQSFQDFEVILVNDGSKDNSGEICQIYAGKDPRIHYIFQENQGVSSARNAGLDAAGGETVYFADSDDWLEKDALSLLLGGYLKYNADLVVADMSFIRKGKKRLVRIFDKTFTTDSKQWISNYQRACIGYGYNPNPGGSKKSAGLGSMGNKLYRKEIIDDNNLRFDLYVKGIYEDNLFVINFLQHCNIVSYFAESIYNYRMVEGSNSRGFKENTLDINDRIFEKIKEFIEANKADERDAYYKAFYMYVIRRLEVSLFVYFFADDNSETLSKRLKLLHNTIRQEPYKEAIKKVEYRLLKPYNRFTWATARTYSAIIIWLGMKISGTISRVYHLLRG